MARQGRSYSTTEAQAILKAQIRHVRSSSTSTVLNENGGKVAGASKIQRRTSMVNTVAVTDSDYEIAAIGSTDKAEASPSDDDGDLSWWKKVLGRRKSGAEHHV